LEALQVIPEAQVPQFRIEPQPLLIEPHCSPAEAQVVGVHDVLQSPR
jgi:hypothetical protein